MDNSEKKKYYCFLCSSEKRNFSEKINCSFGTVVRNPNKFYDETEIRNFKNIILEYYGEKIVNVHPCLSFEEYTLNLKLKNRRPKCSAGAKVCDECFNFYSISVYLDSLSGDEGNTKILIEKVNEDLNKKKVEYNFILNNYMSNRLLKNKINPTKMDNKSERDKARIQFKKIMDLTKSFLEFMAKSFENYPLKFSFCANFDVTSKIGIKIPMVCELVVESSGVIRELEISEYNQRKTLEMVHVYDLWSLLTAIQFIKVRKLLNHMIYIPNIKKFYENKTKIDEKLLNSKIIQAIKTERISGIIIPIKNIFLSLVYNRKKITEMGVLCRKKIENLGKNNEKLKFKFTTRRFIKFKKKEVLFRNEKYDGILCCNFPIGEGPDETPNEKNLKKNLYTSMINILNLIDTNSPQKLENGLLLYILSYKGNIKQSEFIEIFGNGFWNKELKSCEKMCFVREIDKSSAESISNDLIDHSVSKILLIVRFHFHFCQDEAQFQMNQCELKAKTSVIQTRVELDTKKNERKSGFYYNPCEKLGKNTKIKSVKEMELNTKVIHFLKGNAKTIQSKFKTCVFGKGHLYEGFSSKRGHIDFGVHEPKRNGGLDLGFIIFLYQKIVLPSIKEIKRRFESRNLFMELLVKTGVVDKSIIMNKKKELQWSKLISKMDSVLNITGDKRKIIIGIVFSTSKDFMSEVIQLTELIFKTNQITEDVKCVVMEWLYEMKLYCFTEQDSHRFFTQNLLLCISDIEHSGGKITDKQSIFRQFIATLVKKFPRYLFYKFNFKCSLYDLIENGDTASFSCSLKEMFMAKFRQFWGRSPKFRKFQIRELMFVDYKNKSVIENDEYLNTLFCIATHWVMENEITKDLYVNFDKIFQKVSIITLDVIPEDWKKDFPNFFIENVDNLCNEIPNINNEVENEKIVDISYFVKYQEKLTELLNKTRLLLKERKKNLVVINLDWSSFETILKGSCDGTFRLKDTQVGCLKKWIKKLKEFEDVSKDSSKIVSFLLLWLMGLGKTYILVFLMIAWINHMKLKFKFENQHKPCCIVFVPKFLTTQFIGDLDFIFLKFNLKPLYYVNICDVGSVRKLHIILKTISQKGGILVCNPEKFQKIGKMCGKYSDIKIEKDQEEFIQFENGDFGNEEFTKVCNSVLFENENVFCIIDECSHLFHKHNKFFKGLTYSRRALSTGTPVEKFGETFFEVLEFSFYEKFLPKYRTCAKQLISFLEKLNDSCEDCDKIKEYCLSIREFLELDSIKDFISINMNKIPNRSEYFLFFEPSEYFEEKLDENNSNILQKRIEYCGLSVCGEILTELKSKLSFKTYLSRIMGELKENSKRKEKDILKFGSGVLFFNWKFLKNCKGFNKKVVFSSEFVKILDFMSIVCEESKFQHKSRLKPYCGRITSAKTKNEIITNFTESLGNEILLLSMLSGGFGLNLQKNCSDMIVSAVPWNYSLYDQVVSRLDRPGGIGVVRIKLPMTIDYENKIHLNMIKKLFLKRNVITAMFTKGKTNFSISTPFIEECIKKCNLRHCPSEIKDEFIRRYIEKTDVDAPEFIKIKNVFRMKDLLVLLNEASKKRNREDLIDNILEQSNKKKRRTRFKNKKKRERKGGKDTEEDNIEPKKKKKKK